MARLCLNDIIDQLKVNGFKVTAQRQLVIEVLLEAQDRFLSVEDIYRVVKATSPALNMTTVYRNLEALASLGLLDKTLFDNQTAYFKLVCHRHHHHHMICTDCGRMTAIDYCPMESLKRMAKAHHFTIEGHRLEVFGRCGDCMEKKKRSSV